MALRVYRFSERLIDEIEAICNAINSAETTLAEKNILEKRLEEIYEIYFVESGGRNEHCLEGRRYSISQS